jgi:hypothetical protein
MTPASRSRVRSIESFFRTNDDGEFCVFPAEVISEVSGDFQAARTILYSTKASCLSYCRNVWASEIPVAIIARPGLPVATDLALMVGSSPPPRRVFIGDADPPDLLSFAWFRERLPITWHGVSDELLNRFGLVECSSIVIPMSPAERESLALLQEVCPDFRSLVGDYCASLFAVGAKIELDAVVCSPHA